MIGERVEFVHSAVAELVFSKPVISADVVSEDSEANWADEGPVSTVKPGLDRELPKFDEAAVLAKRLARHVKDVVVVKANGLASERLVRVHAPRTTGPRGNGRA